MRLKLDAEQSGTRARGGNHEAEAVSDEIWLVVTTKGSSKAKLHVEIAF